MYIYTYTYVYARVRGRLRNVRRHVNSKRRIQQDSYVRTISVLGIIQNSTTTFTTNRDELRVELIRLFNPEKCERSRMNPVGSKLLDLKVEFEIGDTNCLKDKLLYTEV